MYCRDTVWRGVIRKAGSRAGKFKDHEEEGMVSVCTKHNLALYVALAWDHSRTEHYIGIRHTTCLRAAQLVPRMCQTATGRNTGRAS